MRLMARSPASSRGGLGPPAPEQQTGARRAPLPPRERPGVEARV